ncbi:MAG: DoxX family membrane protein [Desulfobacterales bacterium]|nr:DoxX family membrane protein [Desulfobacterales bacterium]
MNKTVDKLIRNSWLEVAARWVLGAVFIYASYHKIMEPAQFAKVIYGYYLFPALTINLIAIVLPFLELFCGLALVLGIYPRSAALVINFLLISFIAALSINLIRGQAFDCGCFSVGDRGYTYSVWETLIRDIVFFGFGLVVIFFSRHRKWCVLQSGSILLNMNRSGRV